MAGQLAAALPRPFEPQDWLVRGEEPRSGDLTDAALGLPGVLLTQLATLDLLAAEGLDLTRVGPRRRGRPQPGHPRRRRLRRTTREPARRLGRAAATSS